MCLRPSSTAFSLFNPIKRNETLSEMDLVGRIVPVREAGVEQQLLHVFEATRCQYVAHFYLKIGLCTRLSLAQHALHLQCTVVDPGLNLWVYQ